MTTAKTFIALLAVLITSNVHAQAIIPSTFSGGPLSVAQIIGNSTTPTVAVGPGAGTGATATVTGNNIAGVVNVTTGTTPTASGIVATITFNGTLPTAPQSCQIEARNSATALAVAAVYTTAPSGTSWTITDDTTVLGTSVSYSWGYLCE